MSMDSSYAAGRSCGMDNRGISRTCYLEDSCLLWNNKRLAHGRRGLCEFSTPNVLEIFLKATSDEIKLNLRIKFLERFLTHIPATGWRGGTTPSTVFVKTWILPDNSWRWFFMTLLQTPWPLKNRWLHLNIYFRYLWAWPDVGMTVCTIADFASNQTSQHNDSVT